MAALPRVCCTAHGTTRIQRTACNSGMRLGGLGALNASTRPGRPSSSASSASAHAAMSWLSRRSVVHEQSSPVRGSVAFPPRQKARPLQNPTTQQQNPICVPPAATPARATSSSRPPCPRTVTYLSAHILYYLYLFLYMYLRCEARWGTVRGRAREERLRASARAAWCVEREVCLLKDIAEGTYKTKHAEAAKRYYTTQ